KARNYLSRKLNTRTVAVNNLRFEYGFGFNTLYHPFVEAIRCGQHDTAYRHLVRFYEFMLPYVYTFEEREEVVPVQAWKWGKQRFARYLNESDPFTYNFLCSESLIPEKADKEARKLLKLVDSIARHGYDPRRYNAEPIRGVEINGRVLLLGGQHRAVALAVLGHPALKVEVRDHQNTPGRCDAAEVER